MHRTTRSRLAAGAAAAAIATVPLVAPGPAGAVTKEQRQRGLQTSVYVQGDSLTVGAASQIKAKLRNKVRTVGVDAQVGRFTATGMSRLANDSRAKRARVWVIALGTNDGPDAGRIKGFVNRSLRLAGPQREVVWVTIHRSGGYGSVNRMLRSMDATADRLHVVDWERTVTRNPGLIGGDGVHGTVRGYQIRGDLIANTALYLAQNG